MSIEDLFNEVAAEIKAEQQQSMTDEDRKLHEVAQKLLMLERDMRAPGSARSMDDRVDRLIEAIAKEKI